MTNPKVGETITSPQERDAIHVAIAPTLAACTLYPAQPVGIAGTKDNPIGIVDPFLSSPVYAGEKFWLFLYPGTITSLRHDWTHPAYTQDPNRSEGFLKQVADGLGCSYKLLLEGAQKFIEYGESMHFGHDIDYPNMEDFWKHYEVVTNKVVPIDKKEGFGFFSCSC